MLLLLLAACAAKPVVSGSNATAASKGYLLLSMGPAKADVYASVCNVVLRERATGALTSFAFVTGEAAFVAATKPDFADGRGEGALYLVELPAGSYEIANLRVAQTVSSATITDVSGSAFEVDQGGIAYLARVLISNEWRYTYNALWNKQVVLGPGRSSAVLFDAFDAFDADVALARAEFPELLAAMPTVYRQPSRSPGRQRAIRAPEARRPASALWPATQRS